MPGEMASRQPISSDISQQQVDEDEQVSPPGEGDEIMEEPEEQEDGYSTSIFYFTRFIACSLASLHPYLSFIHFSVPSGLTMSGSAASSTPTSTLTWISWFCSLPGHEYFCEVTEEFIEDDFNLTGLNNMVPFWKEAMEMVLDVEPGVGSLSSSLFSFGSARVMTSPRLFQMRIIQKYRMSPS